MTINNNLKILRTKKGLTLKQLSEIIGMKSKTYQRWEQDINPSNEGLVTLGKFYGVPIELMLTADISQNIKQPGTTKEQELYSRFMIQPPNIKTAILGLLEMSA